MFAARAAAFFSCLAARVRSSDYKRVRSRSCFQWPQLVSTYERKLELQRVRAIKKTHMIDKKI